MMSSHHHSVSHRLLRGRVRRNVILWRHRRSARQAVETLASVDEEEAMLLQQGLREQQDLAHAQSADSGCGLSHQGAPFESCVAMRRDGSRHGRMAAGPAEPGQVEAGPSVLQRIRTDACGEALLLLRSTREHSMCVA